MSTIAAPFPDLAPDASAHERQLAILGQIAEIGLTIAQALERQATDPQNPNPSGAAIGYARVARAVRLTIALQAKLIADAKTSPRAAWNERRTNIVRAVKRVISKDEDVYGQTAEELGRIVSERLETDDIYGDILALPASEIIARICKDLDIHINWSRVAQEAWAQAEIATGAPGAPLAAGPPWPVFVPPWLHDDCRGCEECGVEPDSEDEDDFDDDS